MDYKKTWARGIRDVVNYYNLMRSELGEKSKGLNKNLGRDFFVLGN